jgi:ABC-2 type transport system permease protein
MRQIVLAIRAERMKLRRSKILLVTFGLFVFIPLLIGLMMYVAQHPEMSAKLGLVGAKAQFFSENSWKGYLEIINQLIAVLGVIGFGFITSWVFGREYIEHTLTDILALPVSRSSIVLAKYLVVLFWCLGLAITLFLVASIMGLLMHIPGWNLSVFLNFASNYFLTTIFTILLSTVVGFIVSFSKSIVAPLGFVLLMVIMAQFTALLGWGSYFPWSIPGVFTVSNSVEGMQLFPVSYLILFLTFLLGLFSTYAYWKYADH